MMKKRKLITHPSHAPGEKKILLKPKPKPPEIIDLAKRDKRYWDYVSRLAKRKR